MDPNHLTVATSSPSPSTGVAQNPLPDQPVMYHMHNSPAPQHPNYHHHQPQPQQYNYDGTTAAIPVGVPIYTPVHYQPNVVGHPTAFAAYSSSYDQQQHQQYPPPYAATLHPYEVRYDTVHQYNQGTMMGAIFGVFALCCSGRIQSTPHYREGIKTGLGMHLAGWGLFIVVIFSRAWFIGVVLGILGCVCMFFGDRGRKRLDQQMNTVG
eukprot:PhM_4_TR17553/c0_g1_i2/m.70998